MAVTYFVVMNERSILFMFEKQKIERLEKKVERLKADNERLKKRNAELAKAELQISERMRILLEKEHEYDKLIDDLKKCKSEYTFAINKAKSLQKDIKNVGKVKIK